MEKSVCLEHRSCNISETVQAAYLFPTQKNCVDYICWCTLITSVLSKPITKVWMTMDPYYRWQKRSPGILAMASNRRSLTALAMKTLVHVRYVQAGLLQRHFGGLFINCSGPSAVGLECAGSPYTAVQPCDSCNAWRTPLHGYLYDNDNGLSFSCATLSVPVWLALSLSPGTLRSCQRSPATPMTMR